MRYASGTLPTSKGFTGQRADSATSGLDDYGARYYDPLAEQFTSADTWLAGGLNRYGYVGGNPETFVDPSGHYGQSCEIGLCGGPDNGIPLDQGGNPGGGSFGGGGGEPPPEGNETDPSLTNAPITNPNDPAFGMEPPKYLGSSTETSETELNAEETQHLNQVNEINQEERDQHAGSSTQPGGGVQTTSSAKASTDSLTGADPKQAISDLAAMRQDLGMGEVGSPNGGTLAKLEVGNQSFYGINAHGQPVDLTVNPISSTHAETDVFQQASNAGVTGGDGNLYVDRDLCGACGRSGAVKSMAKQLGLSSLRVFTPSFPDGILWLLG